MPPQHAAVSDVGEAINWDAGVARPIVPCTLWLVFRVGFISRRVGVRKLGSINSSGNTRRRLGVEVDGIGKDGLFGTSSDATVRGMVCRID